MSVRVRPYRAGGWEVDITVRLPNGSRLRERSKAPVSSKSAAQRWGEDRERHLLQHGPPPTTQGGANTRNIRAEIRGRLRARESAETERDRRQGVDPHGASDSAARLEAAGRDHDRTRASAEATSGASRAEDREQRADRAEHVAEEGCRVGRHRADAVCNPPAADLKTLGRILRLRRLRAIGRRSEGGGQQCVPHRAVGWGRGAAMR